MMQSLSFAFPLALADLRREPGAFLVGVAVIAAVLAPVLVLFGLKYGIVSSMTQRLTENPQIRAIHPLGQGRYQSEWLMRLAARDDVGFVMPVTRYLAAEAELLPADASPQLRPLRVELVPTGPGDPLVKQDDLLAQMLVDFAASSVVAAPVDSVVNSDGDVGASFEVEAGEVEAGEVGASGVEAGDFTNSHEAARSDALRDDGIDTQANDSLLISELVTESSDEMPAQLAEDQAAAQRAAALPDAGGVILSLRAAERLGVQTHDRVRMELGRLYHGQRQRVALSLRVVHVLPLEAFSRSAAFVPLALLEATEDYRSAIAVPRFNWQGTAPVHAPAQRRYAGFRLYARELGSIRSLRDWLVAEGIEVETRLSQVELVKAIDRNLGFLFLVVAGLGTGGGALSIALGLWGSVLRKRKSLALLRLLGHSNVTLAAFPAIQGVLTAAVAGVFALLIYQAVEPLMNRVFSSQLAAGESVCRLLPEHAAWAFVLTLLLALFASLFASLRAWQISPAEGLRDD